MFINMNNVERLENWINLIIGVIAIFAIKSLFENDSSKIVSNKGSISLSDEKEMKRINTLISDKETNSPHQQIVV